MSQPNQVQAVNDVFRPSKEEVDEAKRVVAAFEEATKKGKGVFALDGKMVDAPVLELQQRLLERARRAGVLDPGADEPQWATESGA